MFAYRSRLIINRHGYHNSDLRPSESGEKIVERVKNTRDPVVITQRGRPAALLVNYEDYEGMVATLEELSQPDWRERLAEAERDSKAGKGVDLAVFKARKARSGKKG